MEALLFEIVTPEQQTAHHRRRSISTSPTPTRDKARFRANYFYKTTGLAAVFRTIPTKVLTLEDLDARTCVRKLADRRAGLVLVTGPTGSGKSTTLAAMIDHINKTRACHILTIEDPVEFVHVPQKAQVTHREIGPARLELTPHAIRSAGREDPNVILIGELRTNETMKLALQLASFGVAGLRAPCTRTAPPRPSTASSTPSPPTSSRRCAGCSPRASRGSWRSSSSRRPTARGAWRRTRSSIGSPALSAMIREGKTFQIAELDAGRAGAGDADDGHGARAPGAAKGR